MLIIPDISFYQDDNATPQKVDFVKMRQAGAGGVIIRAGQNTWKDPDFSDNWRMAKEAGLWRGSYWFWDSRSPAVKQADLWFSLFARDMPEIGAWMDFEEGYGGSYGTEGHMRDFAEKTLSNFPSSVEVGVYTSPSWWGSRVRSDRLYWSKYPLWIANYKVDRPLVPPPWSEWVYWQYTSKGDGGKYGAESLSIDLNYFYGTREQLAAMFGLDVDPAPRPSPALSLSITLNSNGTLSGNWTNGNSSS